MDKVDCVIIGAGAAGLFAAIEAGKRGRHVMVLDHANKPGKKILMSGGGRCNFTNYHTHPDNYISHNPHFCKSALSRYTAWDFIDLVKRHRIPFHEKTLGQLFCDHKSKDILDMLLHECEAAGVTIRMSTHIEAIEKISDHHFKIHSDRGHFHCESLVIATGGLSIPTMGASPFGYQVAAQFGIKVWPTRAGLVPFTLQPDDKATLAELSGIGIDSIASNERVSFREDMLFTHRGLSGPSMLQLSSYWGPGEAIQVNLLPSAALSDIVEMQKQQQSQKQLNSVLAEYLPRRVVDIFIPPELATKKCIALSSREMDNVIEIITNWAIKPNGTEGYRTAEVTLGGVDCDALSSKTMAANDIPGLYFIGEVVDVTGWLGGYNFQWAWSSGWAAGQVI
jgi:predicted Rossmann fold flavoprotein